MQDIINCEQIDLYDHFYCSFGYTVLIKSRYASQ